MRMDQPFDSSTSNDRSWPGAAIGDRSRIADLGGTCIFSIGRFRKILGTSAPGQELPIGSALVNVRSIRLADVGENQATGWNRHKPDGRANH